VDEQRSTVSRRAFIAGTSLAAVGALTGSTAAWGAEARVVGVNPKTYKWPPPPYNYEEPLPVRLRRGQQVGLRRRGRPPRWRRRSLRCLRTNRSR
jgi:hypothetical protein